jgi:lipopolysaccharide export system permease protein
MKALDKYILKEFFEPLLLVVTGLASLVLLVQVVDMLPRLREWQAPANLIVLYHLASFPYIASQVLPVGVMLATLISLGSMARNSELAAARAGGISSFRLALPILVASFLISLFLLLVSQTLIPRCTYYSRYIQKVLIEKRNLEFDVQWRSNMAKSLSDDRQLYAREYDGALGVMQDVILIQRTKSVIIERYDAKRMAYDPDHGWSLFDGIERTFNAEGDEKTVRHFTQWPVPMTEKPTDFMVDSDKKEQDLLKLSISELAAIIDVLKQTGADYRKELTCLNVCISYPFSCLILALLGVSLPFLFPSGRRAMTGAAMGILVSLGCGMLYLVLIQIGLSLGKSGALPVIPAAWLGNVVFLIIGGFTLLKINR